MSAAVTVPLNPKPVSDALQKHFDDLAKIQTGKSGQVGLAVTTTGVEASITAQRQVKVGTLGVQGWAGREWGGAGWLAGARATWSW